MKEAIKYLIDNYTNFEGRIGLRKFWMTVLWVIIPEFAGMLLAMIFVKSAPAISVLLYLVVGLFSLALLIPSIGITMRRLQDTGKPGIYILLGLIPFVGGLVLLFFCVQAGEPVANAYGPVPIDK